MDKIGLSLGRTTLLVLVVALGSWMTIAPPRTRVVVTDTETTILDAVEFVSGTDVLRPSSRPILDAVAATMLGNPSIALLEVQAHTGGGNPAANLGLSGWRADMVMAYLVRAGVARARLVAQGYGDTQPLGADAARNERVSFVIVRRTPDN